MSREYPCIHWDDGKCKKFSDDKVKSWCIKAPCEYQEPSNADRIRAMSDEELAEFLCGVFDDDECDGKYICGVTIAAYDQFVIAEWLKQPAEEE